MTARERTPSSTRGADRWGAVVAVGITVFITGADMTIVGVALPTLGTDLGVGPTTVQWVVLGYALPLVALGLPLGRWADTMSKRQAFLLAVCGFGVASVLVAVADRLGTVVAARVMQGLFGALISALVLATIARSVRPQMMGRAVGVVAALGPLGAAVGPALGGALIEASGWRSVFLINVPICFVAGWLGLRSIPADDMGLALPRRSWLLDAILLGAGGTAFLLGLQAADPTRGTPILALSLLVLAIVVTAVWTRRPDARVALGMLADPLPRYWLIASCCGGAVTGTLGFLAPFHLTDGLRVSPTVAGLVLLALPAGMVAAAPFGGMIGDRWGHHRAGVLGTALVLTGTVALLGASGDWRAVDLAWRLALVGAGTGLLAGPCQAAVMNAVSPDRGATAGAFSSLTLNLGFAIGPPLGVLTWRMGGGSPADIPAGYTTAVVTAALSLLAVCMVVVSRRA
ncbi:Predicted arabinose efflux permease, MFS family [Micromonospora carbonacea]|uniref:Predicted arabinose efflux permease, MFS family n=1 Tax=Micromonospora carbonacea TaxID=47853 RepID=A0A1C4VEL3_9ACTN|nr:Predicted arabinose efflux permease, MFS family [Micromonospora carbonacea]